MIYLKSMIIRKKGKRNPLCHPGKIVTSRTKVLRNSYNPARWFKQIKRTVSFAVTTRFNPNHQSIAIYNSHIFNGRKTTIKDQPIHCKYTEVFFYYLCVRQYFYINPTYSKCCYCNVSKLSDYHKIARSFTLFSLRKCMQLHHFIS